jgi:hypothetical protein
MGLFDKLFGKKENQPAKQSLDTNENIQEQETVSHTAIKNFKNEPFPVFDLQQQELEYIIQRLNGLGIKLNERLKINDLKDTEFWLDAQLEEQRGLDLADNVFFMMSYTYEVRQLKEYFPTSEDLCLFYSRWGGSVQYDQVLLNLIRITKIKFDVSDIKNIFSYEKECAGLKFTFNKKKYEFILKYDSDAIDWDFFEKLKEIFSPYLTKNFYRIHYDDHVVVLYTSEDTILKLASFLNFKWDILRLI